MGKIILIYKLLVFAAYSNLGEKIVFLFFSPTLSHGVLFLERIEGKGERQSEILM